MIEPFDPTRDPLAGAQEGRALGVYVHSNKLLAFADWAWGRASKEVRLSVLRHLYQQVTQTAPEERHCRFIDLREMLEYDFTRDTFLALAEEETLDKLPLVAVGYVALYQEGNAFASNAFYRRFKEMNCVSA